MIMSTSSFSSSYSYWHWVLILILVGGVWQSHGKIDSINLEDDQRRLVPLVSFGMYDGGTLAVNLSISFVYETVVNLYEKQAFGLTIDMKRQSSSQIARYGESVVDRGENCALDVLSEEDTLVAKFIILQAPNESVMRINKTARLRDLEITVPSRLSIDKDKQLSAGVPSGSMPRDSDTDTHSTVVNTTTLAQPTTTQYSSPAQREKREAGKPQSTSLSPTIAVMTNTAKDHTPEQRVDNDFIDIPVAMMQDNDSQVIVLNVSFILIVKKKTSAGLYSIYFHNCAPPSSKMATVQRLQANITGWNAKQKTYLSAGDIPEPYLFYAVCIAYILLSFIWLRVLRSATSPVYKTHYLMLAVCYCKALSALFHGTNYYYIGLKGKEETVWAVIYYISYLMKTVMLFLTIMLVGTGWTFIKHVFSDKEKKLFLVAIPLQLLVYIAVVVMGETEVATKSYSTWHTISVVVDLLCCVTILLPVIWSIRHLNEASQTDGKAALNLRKLRLFKTLYVMVISYIYITRLVIYVFKYTLPYQFSWMGDLFTEVAVIGFLVMLLYKFRPADDNPYFQLPPDSDDDSGETAVAVTQSGVSKDAKRRNLRFKVDEADDVEKQTLISGGNKGESSHELD